MSKLIALLQINPKVGDLENNSNRLLEMIELAKSHGADISVSSELALSGYPPRDLLNNQDFIQRCHDIAEKMSPCIPSLVGLPVKSGENRQLPSNAVMRLEKQINSLVKDGMSNVVAKKILLPTYDVFDEARYFEPGTKSGLTRNIAGLDLGVTICEDAWQNASQTPSDYDSNPIEMLAELEYQGVPLDATVNLSASPFHYEKLEVRLNVAKDAAKTLQHPFLLANQVGGNDDLLFDGSSMVAWPNGKAVIAPAWREGILLVDLTNPEACKWIDLPEGYPMRSTPELRILENSESNIFKSSRIQEICDATIVGLGDYCRKSNLNSIVLGMSGGIDSAVAACVACEAIGPENVLGISMPSKFSSQHSISDAEYTCKSLGMDYLEHTIAQMHESTIASIGEMLSKGNPVASENIQARLRAIIVMGFANAQSRMAIATGNKSELSQGFCTLYGDMAGGYAPLGDVWKMDVYAMAELFNSNATSDGMAAPISESTLTKPPSAELAEDQIDEDVLPPYDVLDGILKLYIEQSQSIEEIVTAGFDSKIVNEVISRLGNNEHKRWQMPPAPRISNRAFGQGWRMPLASRKN